MLTQRRVLGLAVAGRSLTAVEVVPANGGGRACRAAEFIFPDGLGLEEPARLGKALKQFLRERRFSASRCLVGMEARWLTARQRTLPPGARETVPQILSLVIEREFASDQKDLLFDYAMGPDQAAERSVLLVAAPRRLVEGISAMAQAAGLKLTGVTSSMVALTAGPAGGSVPGDRLVVRLFRDGAELAVESAGAVRLLRPLPVPVPAGTAPGRASADGWMDRLADELRRVVMLLPGGEADEARELLVWDEAGLDRPAQEALSTRLAMPLRLCSSPAGLELNGLGESHRAGQFASSAALALAAVRRMVLPVDFLHSRLSPRRKLGIGRKVIWAAAVAAACIVAGLVGLVSWQQDQREADDLAGRLQVLAPSIAEAKSVVDRTTFARTWYDHRPEFLVCLRELTTTFPAEGSIWATNVTIQEDMRVVVSGKAVNESAVLAVLDRLKAHRRLSQVKPLYLREAGSRQAREVAFAVSLRFGESE